MKIHFLPTAVKVLVFIVTSFSASVIAEESLSDTTMPLAENAFLTPPQSESLPLEPQAIINAIGHRLAQDTPFKIQIVDAAFYKENIYRIDFLPNVDGKQRALSVLAFDEGASENHRDSINKTALSIAHNSGELQVFHNGKIVLSSSSAHKQYIKHLDYQLNQFPINLPISLQQDDELVFQFLPDESYAIGEIPQIYVSLTYSNSGMASNKWQLLAPAEQATQQIPYLLSDKSGQEIFTGKMAELGTRWSFPQALQAFDIPEKLDYSDWRYFSGTFVDALTQATQHFEGLDFSAYTNAHIDFFLSNVDKVLSQHKQKGIQGGLFGHYQRFALLDDFGPQIVPFLNAKQIQNQSYLKNARKIDNIIRRALTTIQNKVPRLPDGTLTRLTPYKLTVQSDDLFMGGLPLIRAYAVLGKKDLLEDAILQGINFHHYLHDANTGLYRHGYYSPLSQQTVSQWGRGVGWMAMTYVELLEHMPKDHAKYRTIVNIFREFCDAMMKYQSEDGRWHQVLTDNTTYLETSVTAMFTRALAYGVAQSLLEGEQYATAANRGWEALARQVKSDGQVQGIVRGTPIFPNDEAYAKHGTRLNDPRGLGAVIYAAVAIDQMREQLK